MAKHSQSIQSRTRGSVKSIGSLWVFWQFIEPYRVWAIIGVIALTLTSMLNLIFPYLIGRIFDSINDAAVEIKPTYFLAAIGVAMFLAASSFLRVYFVQNLAFRMIADIRAKVFSHVIELSRGFFDQVKSGEIVSRLSGDVTVVGTVLTSNISIALRQFLTLIGGFVMMFITSPLLTGLVSVIVPVILIPLAIISRQLIRLSRKAQDELAEATALAAEAIQNVVTVQSFVQENQIEAKYELRNEAHYQAHRKRLGVYAFLVAFMIFVMLVAVTLVLWVGTNQVRTGILTSGTLVQFLFYSVMVGGAVQSFSNLWSELLRAAGAAQRLAELLQAEDDLKDGTMPLKPVPAKPLIAMQDVSFAYPSNPETRVIQDVSFELKQGETLAFVGPSGAGKSTLLQLLMRHYDAEGGATEMGGQNIKDLHLADLRSQFAYVAQEPAIFAMSIRENIAFANPEATQAEIEQAARSAYAHDFIEAMSEGYQTYVGERGLRLSGGQKARIALARAFLSPAPILLLDEATAALDAKSEHYVQLALEELHKTRTVVVIAHRLATVQRANEILVLDQGRLIEQGTHQELMKTSNLYTRLAKMQFLAT